MTDVGRRRHTAFPEKREKGKKGRLVQSKLFITINNTVKTSYEQHIYIYTYVTRPHHSTRNIPVNMPDLIQTVMAIKASVQPELGQIIYARSDFTHPVWFSSSKEGMDHTVQNQPGSNLDGLVRFWPKAPCPEASWCA